MTVFLIDLQNPEAHTLLIQSVLEFDNPDVRNQSFQS